MQCKYQANTHFGLWSSSGKSPIVDTKSGNLRRLFNKHPPSNVKSTRDSQLASTERSSQLAGLENKSTLVLGKGVQGQASFELIVSANESSGVHG